jgi:hypothetical protein
MPGANILGMARIAGTLLEVAGTWCCVLWTAGSGRGVASPTSMIIAGAIAMYGSEGAVTGR